MTETLNLTIKDMTCAGCVARVEKVVANAPGVESVSVDLSFGSGRIEFDPTLISGQSLVDAITQAGYPAKESKQDGSDLISGKGEKIDDLRRAFVLAFVFTLPVFIMEMGSHLIPALMGLIHGTLGHTTSWIIQFALITFVMAVPGRMFFTKGIPALFKLQPDMNSLVAVGTLAAWLYSTLAIFAPAVFPAGTRAVYFESAGVIITLILLGRWLEARASGQTGAAIQKLIALNVDEASVKIGDNFELMPVDKVKVGDILLAKSGERIALDGTALEGHSFVDESMVTGEPIPVEKVAGDAVIGGSINGNGTLIYRADAVGEDTVLAQIIEMVRNAQSTKLPIQALVNSITLIFVPVILGLAALTFLIWSIFGPEPTLPYAFITATSVLIIACPCAMGLATPLSITVGSGRAAEMGILFRQGHALQKLQAVDVVALDKTGTLTNGTPKIVGIQTAANWSREDAINLAAAVEQFSDHPIAKALIEEQTNANMGPVTDFKTTPGEGVEAKVGDRLVRLVSERATPRSEGSEPLFSESGKAASRGETPVFLVVDGQAVAAIFLGDTLKDDAQATIDDLKSMGVSVAIVSGDKMETTQFVASKLGIERVYAEVDPRGKVETLNELTREVGKTCFVGDGINDSPVLAHAHVGIALGTGTDVAVESADVVLMSGKLQNVANAIRISRATMRNIKQNLIWAFGYNVALIPVAAGLLYYFGGPLLSPMLAAAAMALSSVFVVTNALRLRKLAR